MLRECEGIDVRRTGWIVAGCAVHAIFAVVVLIAGCEGNNRKSALTEEEIRQRTYAPLPARPDEILISGETITCEDVMISLSG